MSGRHLFVRVLDQRQFSQQSRNNATMREAKRAATGSERKTGHKGKCGRLHGRRVKREQL